MEQQDLLYIAIMAVLTLLSGYFSATEAAYSTVNATRLKALAEEENKKAEAALDLTENHSDKLLTTILIGNTVVNVAIASMGVVLFSRLMESSGALISGIVMALVILIFGEVTPKSLAIDHPEAMAMFASGSIRSFMWLLNPVSWLFRQWKKLLGCLVRKESDRRVTQDELLDLVDEAEEEGGIDEQEGELLRSALEFRDLTAGDILTHRTDLEMVPADATKDEIARVFTETRFSRVLVFGESVDNIVGVIHHKDFYTGMGVTKQAVSKIMTEPLFVPDSVKISDLLELLQKAKVHIAVVTDEYGGTQGIVTMEDILEELVGDIWDEHDEVEETFIKSGADAFRVMGSTDIEDFCEHFGIEADEEEFESSTVSGWVMEQMGRVPETGESFRHANLIVRVTKSDARHVVEVEVRKIAEAVPEATEE